MMVVQELVAQHYGLEGDWKRLPGELDENYLLVTKGVKYIVKISRKGEDRKALEFQHAMMQYLKEGAAEVVTPYFERALPTDGEAQGATIVTLEEGRFLRVLTWIDGQLWAKTNPQGEGLLIHLGRQLGRLSKGLDGFEHPYANRFLKWDLKQTTWIEPHLDLFEGQQRELIHHFYKYYKKEIATKAGELRRSIIQGDANDYNIVVEREEERATVKGFIDLGDAVETQTINELAIALTYAMMDKADPLAAGAMVVKGYHTVYPLEKKEVEVLFGLVIARLLISLTASAINKKEHPENEYLLISERPAWALLKQLKSIHPAFALASFRAACGWEPCSKRAAFDQWIATRPVFSPIVKKNLATAKIKKMDLSVGSLELGHNRFFEDTVLFERRIAELLEGYDLGLGGYGECRPVYTTDAYAEEGNSGPRWRSMHIGLDVWMEAEETIFAPFDGFVHSFKDNANDRDYGPCLILEHQMESGVFYTLYGHLSRGDIEHWQVGQAIRAGDPIATLGTTAENGGWPPHLHFQVMLDLMGNEGDFPGVAYPEEAAVWKSICPDPNLILGCTKPILPKGKSKNKLLERRKKNLGKSLSISYENPLHITRGHMQYLYSASGRRYLDTVNNVPHVGHQHWKIVEAIQKQAAVLNTNTRYVHHLILDYSEALAACFPAPLEVVFLVNSGSEANELALRMAKTVTARQDMLALEVGYHGNTNAAVGVSSYKFDGKGGQGAPGQTHVIPIPDAYRGIYQGLESGGQYAELVKERVDRLATEDKRVAALIAEPILSCGGQVVPPKGFFEKAYEHVRKAGGLCIMDEVQVGFGRVGSAFWGFEWHGVVPDIVTLGKPIANGHPMGAVVTTKAIAEAFANGMEFFSTFGGNPVSCAAAKAVLDVVKEDNLQAHAQAVGASLLKGYEGLMDQFPIIGDVRGEGLFLGFELVKDRVSKIPYPEAASYIANRMRTLGVLMSTDGPFHNVIKTKPPMCFDQRNVGQVVDTLEKVLKEDFLKKD